MTVASKNTSFFSATAFLDGVKAPVEGGSQLWTTLIYGVTGLLLGSSIAWSKAETGGAPSGRLGPIRLP